MQHNRKCDDCGEVFFVSEGSRLPGLCKSCTEGYLRNHISQIEKDLIPSNAMAHDDFSANEYSSGAAPPYTVTIYPEKAAEDIFPPKPVKSSSVESPMVEFPTVESPMADLPEVKTTTPPQPVEVQFEYKVKKFDQAFTDRDIEKLLNKYGSEGWKLITAVGWTLYLFRPKMGS